MFNRMSPQEQGGVYAFYCCAAKPPRLVTQPRKSTSPPRNVLFNGGNPTCRSRLGGRHVTPEVAPGVDIHPGVAGGHPLGTHSGRGHKPARQWLPLRSHATAPYSAAESQRPAGKAGHMGPQGTGHTQNTLIHTARTPSPMRFAPSATARSPEPWTCVWSGLRRPRLGVHERARKPARPHCAGPRAGASLKQ